MVELTLPELSAGEHVEVTIRRNGASPNGAVTNACRTFGALRGKIRIADDFDAPLGDFGEYI